MRIALVSTGLGRVLRGFESFTESLFQALRAYAPEIDLTLFQGGGKCGKRRHVIPNFHRYDAPARWLGYEKGNLLEKRSFALALYPFLRREKFDIVHYNELVMGSALYHLRRFWGGNYKLLYCGGSTWSPAHYGHRCDFAQLLTGPMYKDALAFGIPEERLFLIPYGLDARQFSPNSRAERSAVRAELAIPDNALVVLTVASLDRAAKRIDYLINELSKLDQPVWLLAAGQKTPDTPGLEQEAKHFLEGRWRFVSWPQSRVHLLYGAADIFVLTSLVEAFGRVIIEALLTGLPTIIHHGPIFKWVTEGTSARTIDMSVVGSLSHALTSILSNNAISWVRHDSASRFTWERLIPKYLGMYNRVAGDS